MVGINISPNQTIPPVQPVQRGEIRQSKLGEGRAKRDYENQVSAEKKEGILAVSHSEQELSDVVRRANKAFEWAKRHFEYSVHDETNTFVVRVFDSETNELIREIPPERLLDLVARLWEVAGLIVDERV